MNTSLPLTLPLLEVGRTLKIASAPEGQDARLMAELALSGQTVLHISRDEARMERLAAAIDWFAPPIQALRFPSWDCLPYDRVSPKLAIMAKRMEILGQLTEYQQQSAHRQGKNNSQDAGMIVISTVAAFLQRLPPDSVHYHLHIGARKDRDALIKWLSMMGYERLEQVTGPGEFAPRGGIIDVFPARLSTPLRIDFFGDEIESMRYFDPVSQKSLSQRSQGSLEEITISPASECPFDREAIERFRTSYRRLFGTGRGKDPLYQAMSAGVRFAGMEHWLPLFLDDMTRLPDKLPGAVITLDADAMALMTARYDMIVENYDARRHREEEGSYQPLPPDLLYIPPDEITALISERASACLESFVASDHDRHVWNGGGGTLGDFAADRAQGILFDAVAQRIQREQQQGRRVVIAASGEGSRDRLGRLLKEHGVHDIQPVAHAKEAWNLPKDVVATAILALERGFIASDLIVITEHDIFGKQLAHIARKRRRTGRIFSDIHAITEGDLLVHIEQGIGCYQGLRTLDIGGAPHDCLELIYEGGDKLFVPVENMDALTRHGSDQATLDRMGAASWQARRARVKQRITDMARELAQLAAERRLRTAAKIAVPENLTLEFAARFPHDETEDQENAINEVMTDLASGQPTDRLICGDVGFGKTEVALRAAFVTAMAGKQVAIVAPTTLLVRQHERLFCERFQGFPVEIAALSRLTLPKERDKIKKGIAEGGISITIGTHGLLAAQFVDLGLLIIDEEQHFGVKQKEKLKHMRGEIHILTLTATPIPRTLQMALSGLRDLSLITTAPVDRLAVHSFVGPFDALSVRQALRREKERGGQSYIVAPRIADLGPLTDRIARIVPELRLAIAHGRMAATELDHVMQDFYDRHVDVLLSTNIIESGLDVPTANTLIIHRADRFGLAELYQLRGRVGRSKRQAYAYLTYPLGSQPTAGALKRLRVMDSLDELGSGFRVASYDMDIRGAGNLLGSEQSGHVKEVGIELYQHMVEEAMAEASENGEERSEESQPAVSPRINLGLAILIPEDYISTLSLRLELYRRLSQLDDQESIEAFAAELIDRFGPLPESVETLLAVVSMKPACRAARLEKVDAGPRGAVLHFEHSGFPQPEKLASFVVKHADRLSLRPEGKLIYRGVSWEDPAHRMIGLRKLLNALSQLAADSERA